MTPGTLDEVTVTASRNRAPLPSTMTIAQLAVPKAIALPGIPNTGGRIFTNRTVTTEVGDLVEEYTATEGYRFNDTAWEYNIGNPSVAFLAPWRSIELITEASEGSATLTINYITGELYFGTAGLPSRIAPRPVPTSPPALSAPPLESSPGGPVSVPLPTIRF